MTHTYSIEYTDTFGGVANYSWIKRDAVTVPDLTHYGYDGHDNLPKANKAQRIQLLKKAKAAVGLTGVRGVVTDYGDMIEFRPYRMCTVLFINFSERSTAE